jgi:hypothetical protein
MYRQPAAEVKLSIVQRLALDNGRDGGKFRFAAQGTLPVRAEDDAAAPGQPYHGLAIQQACTPFIIGDRRSVYSCRYGLPRPEPTGKYGARYKPISLWIPWRERVKVLVCTRNESDNLLVDFTVSVLQSFLFHSKES